MDEKLLLNSIREIISDEVGKKLKEELQPIKEDIKELKSDVSIIKKRVEGVFEQTHDLTEFRTSTTDTLERIEYKVDRADNDIINLKTKLKVIK